jgi:tetratricopeptide (TPR) repeat protein
LELFIPVCEAVQHAHQKGIIHRDLKPSNVLVTVQDGRPVPKVIDFGLAKALGYQLTDRTLETQKDQILGTPAYMSPEQTGGSGSDVDTRTDIYSLGVMLYEVLAGALPVDPDALASTGSDLRHAIKYSDPPKPSSRLQGLGASQHAIAAHRNTDPATLHRQLRGDLDWITLAAIEKDRTRRYETANGLTRDLQRHLQHEPVQARPPSTAYRVGKFARRHKAGVVTSLVAVLGLVAGLAATTTLWIRATNAERVATTEAETAQQVSQFLEGLFEVSDPGQSRGNTVTAREILNRGAENISSELADQPVVQTRLMSTVGRVYRSLGLYDEAASMFEQSLAIRVETLGDDHPDIAPNLNSLAGLHVRQGRSAEAEPLLQRALTIQEKWLAPTAPQLGTTLSLLAEVASRLQKHPEAESYAIRALAVREASLGPDHPEVGRSKKTLANLYSRQGKYSAAEPLYRQALEIEEQSLGADHPDLALTLIGLSRIYFFQSKYAEQERVLQRAVAIQEKTLGPDHPDFGYTLNGLAIAYKEQGKYAEAEVYYGRALGIWERAHGTESPVILPALWNLAELYVLQGAYADAEERLQRSLAVAEQVYGSDDFNAAISLERIGFLYVQQAKYAEAIPGLQRAAAVYEAIGSPSYERLAATLSLLAEAYTQLERYADAEAAHQQHIAVVEAALGPDNINVAAALEGYAALLRRMDRGDQADSLEARADSIRARQSGGGGSGN